jgi:hypothetical protein
MPIGALMVGAAAEVIGEPAVVMTNALIVLGFAAVLWWRVPSLRALG